MKKSVSSKNPIQCYICTTTRINIKQYTLMEFIHTKEDNRTKRSHPMQYGCVILCFSTKNQIECYIDVLLNAFLLNDMIYCTLELL